MRMTTPTQPLFTFDEFLAYDDGTDRRYELEDGILVEMPPDSPENLAIARFLLVEFLNYLPLQRIAYNTEIEVSGYRAQCRIPDLLVHTEESLLALAGAARATLTRDMPAPMLVIEVVSPGSMNVIRDYRYKRTEYAARGIAEYWIVDPQERQVTLCQWIDGQYEDTLVKGSEPIPSRVIPALALTVDQLFSSPSTPDK